MHNIAPALQRFLICANFLLKQFENGKKHAVWDCRILMHPASRIAHPAECSALLREASAFILCLTIEHIIPKKQEAKPPSSGTA
jgi:hypothetical protein